MRHLNKFWYNFLLVLLEPLDQIRLGLVLSFVRTLVTQVGGKTDVSSMILRVAIICVVKYGVSSTVASRRIAFSISVFIR